MTLPAARPLCPIGDKTVIRTNHQAAFRRSRTGCLSAAWADLPSITAAAAAKKQQGALARRRAVCSWHVDYGSLQELDQDSTQQLSSNGRTDFNNDEKVEENISLLELSLTSKIRNGTANPNSKSNLKTHLAAVPVPTHANATFTTVQGVGNNIHNKTSQPTPTTHQQPFAGAMPSLRSLFSKSKSTGGATYEDNNSSATTPLVKVNGEAAEPVVKPAGSLASLRKCETVLALTGILRSASSSSSITQPLQPLNRLRVHPENSHSRLCSRCSSLLTLASGSRYSLDSATGGFAKVPEQVEPVVPVLCKLCLVEVPTDTVVRLQNCECVFCSECMKQYVEFEIAEGAYDISCPDAQCSSQGVLQFDEINTLAGNKLFEKHKKYRLNREVELDKNRCWCPRAGCETVCNLCPSQPCLPQSVFCPTCSSDFCSNCKLEWHDGATCKENERRLAKEGKGNVDIGIPFDSDLIKCCPMCNVPIEKDEGCAQMMCKRCKHVFCWYCLASLDDDFLLRHYDKGPCKNKLGHSRASVIWHRTQVIGIFAGFGILLLVASPLLLLAAPCIVCCKCRICNAGNTRLDNEEEARASDE